jgi:hypothetical protein
MEENLTGRLEMQAGGHLLGLGRSRGSGLDGIERAT